ncbi:hypothetical protein [Streptomyces sp. NPDC002994]|uniref:hypothetical protein n=1 Tax=Streptomyces sp. NPDC002994 TaxID=3154441 RepID=UPI0033BE5E01
MTLQTPPMVQPSDNGWGIVAAGSHPSQAHAWTAWLTGFGPQDSFFFQAHAPEAADAPGHASGRQTLHELKASGSALGKVAAPMSRAARNALLSPSAGPDVSAERGTAHADSRLASGDVALAYAVDPDGGAPLSPFGVHVEAATAEAVTKPGQPVTLASGARHAYVTSAGRKVATVPAEWPVNFSVRIPADTSQPVAALVVFNEQVTTDAQGRPTLGKDGRYAYDPKSTSGYVNAVRLTVYGERRAELTMGHAAVLRVSQ